MKVDGSLVSVNISPHPRLQREVSEKHGAEGDSMQQVLGELVDAKKGELDKLAPPKLTPHEVASKIRTLLSVG